MEERINELISEKAQLTVRISQLDQAYAIQSELHGLKVSDIETLMSSNLKVAESIQNFTRKIPGGSAAASNYSISDLQSALTALKSKVANID